MKSKKDLSLLYSAVVRPSSNALPSWVPDWRVSPICHGLSTAIDKTADSSIHSAAGNSEAAWYLAGDGTVAVRGYAIDTIKRIGPPLRKQPENELPSWDRSLELDDWDRSSRAVASTLDGDRLEDYWRTIIANKSHDGTAASSLYGTAYKDFKTMCQVIAEQRANADFGLHKLAHLKLGYIFSLALAQAAEGRRFCVTANERMGLVPRDALMGDEICILLGGHVPFVLRRDDKKGACWSLVWECYLHGSMSLSPGETIEKTFEIGEFLIK